MTLQDKLIQEIDRLLHSLIDRTDLPTDAADNVSEAHKILHALAGMISSHPEIRAAFMKDEGDAWEKLFAHIPIMRRGDPRIEPEPECDWNPDKEI